MPCRTQGLDARVDLFHMAAKRFFSLVDASKDLIVRKLVFRLRPDSAPPIRREELIVEGILIGALPNLLTIFVGKLGDLSGECAVILMSKALTMEAIKYGSYKGSGL